MKKEICGGIVSMFIVLSGSLMVGQLSDWKAMELLQAMLPSARFFCAAIITSTSTILALILTLISFSSQTEKNIKPAHFERIIRIAEFATAGFIAAIILLMILNLPLEKSSDKIMAYFEVLYYVFLFYIAALGGLLITIILMLYTAAVQIINLVHPNRKTDLLIREEEE